MVRFPLPVLAIFVWALPPVLASVQVSDDLSSLSEDARKMHERLVELSHGDRSLESLRIEFMDGSMAAHRSVTVEAGRLTTKEWKAPGASMIQLEGSVTDERLAELLRVLVDRQYWSFRGTRFVPDAPVFLFRFYDGELEPVDYSCDAEEIESSPTRSAIRDAFLTLVSDTELESVPPE